MNNLDNHLDNYDTVDNVDNVDTVDNVEAIGSKIMQLLTKSRKREFSLTLQYGFSCRRNCICYRVTCILCLEAGRPADVSNHLKSPCYYGQSAKNMHCRAKEHVSKFNSKSEKIRAESAFYKHLMNSHGGKSDDKNFSDYFEIQILKAYKKPFTMLVEEGTYISNHKGELLNSKSEWHQAKIIRTTTQVIQGGADLLRQGQGGRRVGL